MQAQLAEIIESLKSAQARVRALSDTLPESAWNKRPGPDRWSAAECVEHLNITSRAYLPLLRDAFARAGEARRTPTRHYQRDALGWFMSMMIGPIHHLGKLRVVPIKTLPKFVPKAGRSRAEVLSDFVRLQGDLISLIQRADGLPIDDVKIVSPFGERMRYNSYSALVIVSRHQHRHLQQAEKAAR